MRWRTANFKTLAHELVTRFNGIIPEDRKELLSLTGVGPYVADAIRCFAFNLEATLVDTNTVRVAARYFGFAYDPESRRRSSVIKAISSLIEPQKSAEANYALLDFAAKICHVQKPDHSNCPLATRCIYYQSTNIHPPNKK